MNRLIINIITGIALSTSTTLAIAVDVLSTFKLANPETIGIIAASEKARRLCSESNGENCENIGALFLEMMAAKVKSEDIVKSQKEMNEWCTLIQPDKYIKTEISSFLRKNYDFINDANNLKTLLAKQEVYTPIEKENLEEIIKYNKGDLEIRIDKYTNCVDIYTRKNPFLVAYISVTYWYNPYTFLGSVIGLSQIAMLSEKLEDHTENIKNLDTSKAITGINFNPYTSVAPSQIYKEATTSHSHNALLIETHPLNNSWKAIAYNKSKKLPNKTLSYSAKKDHSESPLNPILTEIYMDFLIKEKNTNELKSTVTFINEIIKPLKLAEAKTGISALDSPNASWAIAIHPACLSNLEDEKYLCSEREKIKFPEAYKQAKQLASLFKMRAELYEAAGKQCQKLQLPVYYQNYFYHFSKQLYTASIEEGYRMGAIRDKARELAATSIQNSETPASSQTSDMPSLFGQMVESTRPFLKGKDMQRLNQYQSGMDLMNAIMGQ